LQGISSLSAKDPSPSPLGSVDAICTLPVSALKDFKRNSSSLSDSSKAYRRHHSETNTIITTEDKRETDV